MNDDHEPELPAQEIDIPTCEGCAMPLPECYCYCEPDDYSGCSSCGGRGWFVDCIDDLCHGQDYCIHGDPPSPCFECNRKGEREDTWW